MSDLVNIDSQSIIEAFKLYPGYIILGFVIVLLYKLLVKKDEVIRMMMKTGEAETQQRSRITTLLEILVNRQEKSK